MTNGPSPQETAAPTDTRYAEAEVARILQLATEGEAIERRAVPSALDESREGLTLADLHRIGEEVGIARDRLTTAARLLDADRMVVKRVTATSFELSATFHFTNAPSEETWGRMVAVLRDAFDDTGAVTTEGPLLRWRSKEYERQDVSRMEARLEPDPHGTGWRLILASRAVDHTTSVGAVLAGLGAVITAVPFGLGLPRLALLGAFVIVCGGVVFASGYRARGTWRQQRALQFNTAVAGLRRLGLNGTLNPRE